MVAFDMFGIPVSIHLSSVVVLAFLGWGLGGGVVGLVLWLVVAWVALLVHEGGHALAFTSFRHRVEIEIAGLGGLTRSLGGPPLLPWQHALTSVAGPLAGYAAGVAALVGIYAAGLLGLDEGSNLVWALSLFMVVNLVWSTFNLLPIVPMDGGQALRSFLQIVRPAQAETIARAVSVVFSGGLVLLGWATGMWFTVFLGVLFLVGNLAPASPAR